LSGCAVATKALSPQCKIIGVEPEAGNDVQQSFAKGEPVSIDVPKTIADGAQTQRVGNLTFPVIQALVSQITTASDAQLIRTMQFFAQRMKLVVEPTGCLAAAAVLERTVDVKGARVGVILSGGNVDMQKYANWLGAV
jgi:threo-3-hydroxy-L-aspartate ammonia-lyase